MTHFAFPWKTIVQQQCQLAAAEPGTQTAEEASWLDSPQACVSLGPLLVGLTISGVSGWNKLGVFLCLLSLAFPIPLCSCVCVCEREFVCASPCHVCSSLNTVFVN